MNALRTSITAPRRLVITSLLILPCLAAAIIAGCGDDDDAKPSTFLDAGSDVNNGPVDATVADNFVPNPGTDAGDAGPTDAGVDAAALEALRKRGDYLVNAVVACGDCHTPRDATGKPIADKFLSGVDCFIDVDGPATDGGCLSSRNLTNDATGLKNRSDAEIKDMFMNGKRPGGEALVNVMPYYTLHNLTADDADAIVAYLRTVAPVAHQVRPNDPPFTGIPAPSPAFDATMLPIAGDAGLEAGANLDNGRYLAQFACMECHTKHLDPGAATVLDMAKLFAGNESFPAASLGLPTTGPHAFPETIYSANITQDDNALKGWTVGDIQKAMVQGADRMDGGVCPPMPAGPAGAFAHLDAGDAVDIASYVHGLPGIANDIDGGSGSCVVQ